jgi:hypothetical protein
MNRMRILVLAVVSLLLSDAACGAGATFGTRDQLRDCMALDEALKLREQALAASLQLNEKQVDENHAESARLLQMKQSLDRGDKAAVLKFNEAAVAHNQHVQQAHEADDRAAAATQAYNDDRTAMDRKCGQLTYRPIDMDAVSRERRKAAAVAVAASAP